MGAEKAVAQNTRWILFFSLLLAAAAGALAPAHAGEGHRYNGPYTGANLNRVAFPLGGIGAGMFCLDGTGAISHLSVRHRLEFYNEPCTFAALCVKGKEGNTARVLEGPVPGWKRYGPRNTGNGAPGKTYGLPRFREVTFLARFPFAVVSLSDPAVPVEAEITGWSPFVPGDADASSLPVAALEYRFRNRSGKKIEAVFSFNTRNFMALGGRGDGILPMQGGFVLHQAGTEAHPEYEGGFALFVPGEPVTVDHCWFKGGWWDALTLAWENVQTGRLLENPPARGSAPGASLFVPFTLDAGGEKTIRLLAAWYVPKTNLRWGRDAALRGPAFGKAPSRGTAPGQQAVTGFLGEGLVNTYDPSGDGLTGTLTSPDFEITRHYIRFLLGGGNHPGKTCIDLLVDGKAVLTATGRDQEHLEWVTWDVRPFEGKQARIRITDRATGAWGHINVDQIVMTDDPGSLEGADVLNDFEGGSWHGWIAEGPPEPGAAGEASKVTYYAPWYAGRFAGIEEVSAFWKDRYGELRERSARFRNAFYDTTLPPEVVEAVAANLTILKTPTVLRQKDGRLWCWEGCTDERGCCAGSCTHVWNYAQATCHLFPALERSLRETEFFVSQNEEGHQAFRSALPIRPTAHKGPAAADGQLGGIMKVYREWRISGDTAWMKRIWPRVRKSLDYCIETWDPRHRGVLEEPHHNTYDIEYWGPEGHCTSFYLGALAAAVRMGEALGDDVTLYRALLEKGRAYLEKELFNGEYFFQQVRTEGLNAPFRPLDPGANGPGYGAIIAEINAQGPKYQYGAGCLSDGVLGFWIARCAGLGTVIDEAKVKHHLASVFAYNFKKDLSAHANPQRPTYACGAEGGLLLCSWPHGNKPLLPFVYSDEVWTGIEYQAASHLMMEGMVEDGLAIVRACRDRYDGRIRNPFDEYECGHWYGRALASYGLLQGLTGARYDAVEKTLYLDPRVDGDFRSFLCTATGYGVVGLKEGMPFLEVRSGRIDAEHVTVSGKAVR